MACDGWCGHPWCSALQPYRLHPTAESWLLVDAESGEVEDEFWSYEAALETLNEQNDELD